MSFSPLKVPKTRNPCFLSVDRLSTSAGSWEPSAWRLFDVGAFKLQQLTFGSRAFNGARRALNPFKRRAT